MADKRVLLVEGKDDDSVIYHLANHYGILGQFKTKKKDGFRQIIDDLDVELDASDLEQLGVIMDADVDLRARWQSLHSKLLNCGYTALPETSLPEGCIIEEADRPTVGVWIMPDNTQAGILEDFLRWLVPDDDLLWARAERCLNEIPAAERRFSSLSKAHIDTWLAWQEEPGTLLGAAINKRYLNAEAPQAQHLMAWIRTLFRL